MASITRRAAARLAGGCALVFAVACGLSGCAASPYTDVSDYGANVHFKIPRGWQQISGPALARELQTDTGSSPGGQWVAAYDAARKPVAGDFLAFGAAQPFVFAEFGVLSSAVSGHMSYAVLRDIFLPVTTSTRQTAAAQGFPFTGFRQIRDQIVTLGQGVHGVRETFDYAYGGGTDTFDEIALTDAGQTVVFILVLHCTTSCYSRYHAEISYVMSSVTVSRFGKPRSFWTGLVGR